MILENKFKIFVIFLILFLSIGSISANEDVDSSSLAISENGDMSLSDSVVTDDFDLDDSLSSDEGNVNLDSSAEENVIALESSSSNNLGNPSKTLDVIQSLVDSAKDGDTIFLNGNYVHSKNAVNVTKSLTIDGQGSTTLDGNNTANGNAFYIDNNSLNVIIKGITFANKWDSVFYVHSVGSISFENCAFNNNCQGIYILFANSTSIKNCVFNNNGYGSDAIYGGAIHVESLDSKILNCKFLNNSVDVGIDLSTSYGWGGAVYSKCENSEINNCSFISNVAAECGGAIYDVSNQSKILNCVFRNNDAHYWMEDSFTGGRGGAIYSKAKNSLIKACSFISNHAAYGGAIYYEGKNFTVSNSVFNKNSAGTGGAIYKLSKTAAEKKQLKVIKCNFTANKAATGRDVLGGTCSNCIFNYIKLSSKNKTIKKSAKRLVLSVKLTKGKTILKSKKVKFKFRGKTYTAKTNKKGIAKVTIKRSVIKKLKKGKKYTVKISYLKNYIKRTVKVKR